MKHIKIILAALLAITLTACSDTNTAEETALVAETTIETVLSSETTLISETEETTISSETESEIVTEEETDAVSETVIVEDPNNNEEIRQEIREALEKVSDAYALKNAQSGAFSFGSKCKDNYVDSDKLTELSEYSELFAPLNPEIASNEEELLAYMRSCFTENYISDDDLRKQLFTVDEHGFGSYITYDGVLYTFCDYSGVNLRIYDDRSGSDYAAEYKEGFDYGIKEITEYSGNSAKVSTVCIGPSDIDRWVVYLTLEKSPEYGWRIDALSVGDYYTEEKMAQDPISLKIDKINIILGGGNTPENAAEITVDGEIYVQTDLDMSIDEMHEFFGEVFVNINKNTEFPITEIDLKYTPENCIKDREEETKEIVDLYTLYTEKYIDSVYTEQDGVLYHKRNAAKYYLPEFDIDMYTSVGHSFWYKWLLFDQTFTDADGKSFSDYLLIYGECEYNESYDYICTGVYIASELPIKEIK